MCTNEAFDDGFNDILYKQHAAVLDETKHVTFSRSVASWSDPGSEDFDNDEAKHVHTAGHDDIKDNNKSDELDENHNMV